MLRPRLPHVLALALALASLALPLARLARAEGSAEVGVDSHLQSDTVMFVNILNVNERLTWTSANPTSGFGNDPEDNDLKITDPSGTVTTLTTSGAVFTPAVIGVHKLETFHQQDGAWGVVISGANGFTPLAGGRLYSTKWHFSTGTFDDDSSVLDNSFYALVPGGAPSTSVTVAMQFSGLQGNDFNIVANRVGVDGRNGGRSVPRSGNSFTPQFPLYLAPPTIGTNNPITPTLSSVTFTAGASNLIIPGQTTGQFRFDTNADGTYHIVIDANRDGVFNEVSDTDVLLVGLTTSGSNVVTWDGRDRSGNLLPAGAYDAQATVIVGELHFVGEDIETSYKGLRIYEAVAASRTPLPMFWNDTPVQDAAAMPNGAISLETSGPSGVTPNASASAAVANTSARAWGNFNGSGTGKGNETFLDTYVKPRATVSAPRVAQLGYPPTISATASASPSPTAGTTTALSVTGADDQGAAGLTYSWTATSGPAAVAFTQNDSAAARTTTAIFGAPGTYGFLVTVRDGLGLTTSSAVNVVVNATFASIAVTPPSASVVIGKAQGYSASAKDQFGNTLGAPSSFAWSFGGAAGDGAVSPASGGATTFTAGAAVGGPFTITASGGGKSGQASVTVVNAPPTVATAAQASPSPVVGTQAALSVLGADDGGEAALTYTWALVSGPAGVGFAPSGTNAAKGTTASFTSAGAYTIAVTIRDAGSLTVTSTASLVVTQTATSIAVAPPSASVAFHGQVTYTATLKDQFGAAFTSQPASFAWTFAGAAQNGAIGGTSGVFTGGTLAGGPFAVSATASGKTGGAQVTVTNLAPTIASAASVSPAPVTGTSAALAVLGADDGGEPNLTYTWAVQSGPAATFAPNGTGAAKAASATFTQAGSYTFAVTIKDEAGLAVTSTASLTVSQTLASLALAPTSTSVGALGAVGFTASARDQFGAATSAAGVAYSVSGGGAIDAAGVFTAGGAAGGPFTVTASSGAARASGSVTVVEPSISLSASVAPPVADAGDTLVYTLALSNAAGSGAAHRATIAAVLPASITPSAGAFPGSPAGATSSFDGATRTLTLALPSPVAAGGSATVTFSARVLDAIALGVSPAPVPLVPSATAFSTPAAPGKSYGASASASFTPRGLAGVLGLAFGASSEPSTATPSAVAGEVVSLLATIGLPEGTTPALTLEWALPPGLAFVSLAPVTTGAMTAPGLPAPSIAGAVASFGATVNPGDGVAANDALVLALSLRVLPGAAGALPVTLTARSSGAAIGVASLAFAAASPSLAVSVALAPSGAGSIDDPIAALVTVTNTGGARAFEPALSLSLSAAEVDLASITATSAPPGYALSIAGGAVTLQGASGVSLAASAELTLGLSLRVRPGSPAPLAVATAATASATSLPGAAPGEAAVGAASLEARLPIATIGAPLAPALVNRSALDVTGTADPGASVAVTVRDGGGLVATLLATAGAGGAFSTGTSALLDGHTYVLEARATEPAAQGGRTGPSSRTVTVVVDLTPPAIAIAAPAPGSVLSSRRAPITGTAEVGARVTLSLDGGEAVLVTASAAAAGWSFTPPAPLGDGPHAAVAEARDAAGNTALSSTAFRVDTFPPVVALSAPADDARLPLGPVAIAGEVSEPLASIVVTVAGPGVGPLTLTATADAEGRFRAVASGLPEGVPLAAWARATDLAGNTGADCASVRFTLALDAPSVAIAFPEEGRRLAAADLPGQPAPGAASLALTGTATPLASLALVLDGGAPLTATADAQGGYSFALAGLQDGAHEALVTAASGGRTALARSRFAIDRAPPTTTIDAPEDGAALPGALPLVTGASSEPGSRVALTFADGASIAGAVVASDPLTGRFALFPPAPLAPMHLVQITAVSTDRAGNAGPASNQVEVVFDPATPAVSISVVPAGAYLRASPASLAGGVDARPGTDLEVRLDGVSSAVLAANGAWTATAAALVDGPHEVQARAVLGGKEALARSPFTLDTGLPSVAIAGPAAGTETRETRPAISGDAGAPGVDPGCAVTVTLSGPSGTFVVTTTSDALGLWLVAPPAPLADGAYAVSATARDYAGNLSPLPAATDFVVDTTPPAVAITSAPATRDGAPSITGTAEAGTEVTVLFDGPQGPVARTVTAVGGAYAVPTGGLPDGVYTITVRARDRAGNVSETTQTLLIDTTPPAIAIVTPAEGAHVATRASSITGTASDRSGVDAARLSVDGGPFAPLALDAQGGWLLPASGLADGLHALAAEATDALGNVGRASGLFTVDTRAPVATLATPADHARTSEVLPRIAGGVSEPGSTLEVTIEDVTGGLHGALLRVTATSDPRTGAWERCRRRRSTRATTTPCARGRRTPRATRARRRRRTSSRSTPRPRRSRSRRRSRAASCRRARSRSRARPMRARSSRSRSTARGSARPRRTRRARGRSRREPSLPGRTRPRRRPPTAPAARRATRRRSPSSRARRRSRSSAPRTSRGRARRCPSRAGSPRRRTRRSRSRSPGRACRRS